MRDRLTHVRSGVVLAERTTWARSWWSRARGLLGSTIAPGEALVLDPAKQVHTFFMAFPIDVVFCDARDRVLRVATMRPWRVSRWIRRSAYVIELPAGRAAGVAVGDRIEI